MSFIKRGGPTEILEIVTTKDKVDTSDTENKLKQARQDAKNIDKDGNKNELSKNSQ